MEGDVSPAVVRHAPAAEGTGAFRRWADRHEESWLFTFLYVGLAVALSLLVSLFWLVVLVVLHFVLEWMALGAANPRPMRRLAASAWAVKLDVALLAFALVLTLYLESVFGLLGLRSATHVATATRAAGRFATLERTVRGILLSLDDAVYVVRAFAGRKGAAARRAALEHRHAVQAAAAHAKLERHAVGRTGWGAGDWIAIGLMAACLGLMLALPWLAGMDYGAAAGRISDELRPFS